MDLTSYLAVLFGLVLIPTNCLLLPHGHYSCGCFKVSSDGETSFYNLDNIHFGMKQGIFQHDEIEKANKTRVMSDLKKENLISTLDSNCQDNNSHKYKICCTESINYVVGFCCINRDHKVNQSSTVPLSSPSTNFSFLWRMAQNPAHTNMPAPTRISACQMSSKVEALTVQSFNAWSKHTFQLKYLLVACFIYPMVILSIFILLYMHAKKRFDHSSPNNQFPNANSRDFPTDILPASPPSYNSIDPPPYTPISTIFIPSNMQTPLQNNMEGSHPVLMQESL